MAVNKFSDLTHAEFKALYVGGRRAGKQSKSVKKAAKAAAQAQAGTSFDAYIASRGIVTAASVDWRAAGGVTPVKQQGQCGSCWAFASTVATEGALFVGSGKLVPLSEQQITSCDFNNGDGNAGCNGGIQSVALDWMTKQPGQCSEVTYPYTSAGGKDGSCIKGCVPVAKFTQSIQVTPRNQTALEEAITAVPLSLSVDASGAFWQSYSGGVITKSCKCTSDDCLDHGVGGVGFGTDATTGDDYYIVKNSWSADWGMKGYILIGRGSKYGVTGQCGLQIDSTLAVGSAL